MISENTLKNSLWILFGLCVVTISLIPYWIFAEHSATGWYDELDYYVPLYFTRNVLEFFQPFAHNYAGGYAPGQSLMGNELFSLYGFLLKHLELWLANFGLRFLGLSFSFISTFLVLRHFFNQPHFLTFSITCFGIYSTVIPYGWSLDGMGFDFGVYSLLIFAGFAEFRSRRAPWTWTLVASSISSIASSPTFALFQLVFALIFFKLFCRSSLSFQSQETKRLFTILLVFGFSHALNWMGALKLAVLDASEYSSRILGTLSSSPLQSVSYWEFIVKIKFFTEEFFSTFQRSPNDKLILLYLCVAVLFLLRKEWRKSLGFTGFVFSPILFNVLFSNSELPIVSSFRFSTLWLIMPLLLSYLFLYLWNLRALPKWFLKNSVLANTLSSAVLLIASFFCIYQLNHLTFLELKQGTNSSSLLSSSIGLEPLGKDAKNYRSISAGYVGVIPVFHGVATYDGIVHNAPYRRNYFSAYALSEPPKKTFHVHRLFFYNYPDGFNPAALKIANVKYIVSDHELTSPLYKLIYFRKEMFSDEISFFGASLFHFFSKKIRVHAPLFVYQFADQETWDRVFAASSVSVSDHSFDTQEFHQQLLSLPRNSSLISSADLDSSDSNLFAGGIEVQSYQLTESGIEVSVSSESGMIVYNQVHLPKWKAFCTNPSNRELSIYPVNGIMMGVHVDGRCQKIKFEFQP